MAYCKNCGKELTAQESFCPICGAAQNDSTPPVVDNGGFWWGVLGCCIPIVGLILFLVWKDTKPNTAKAAGIGALVYAICLGAFYLVSILAGVSAAMLGF